MKGTLCQNGETNSCHTIDQSRMFSAFCFDCLRPRIQSHRLPVHRSHIQQQLIPIRVTPGRLIPAELPEIFGLWLSWPEKQVHTLGGSCVGQRRQEERSTLLGGTAQYWAHPTLFSIGEFHSRDSSLPSGTNENRTGHHYARSIMPSSSKFHSVCLPAVNVR